MCHEKFNMDEIDRFCELVGPNGEFPVDTVYFHNDLLEPHIYQIGYNDVHALSTLLATLMPGFVSITLPFDIGGCVAVRMFLQNWDTDSTTNFGFASFLMKMGFHQISAKCNAALVVGVNDNAVHHDMFVSLPPSSYRQAIPVIPVGIDGRIDIACDTPLAGKPVDTFRQLMRMMEGGSELRLNLKCVCCTRDRRGCDYTVRCNRCKGNNFFCSPSASEWAARAKQLHTDILTNMVSHHNFGKYILHTQAVCQSGTMLGTKNLDQVRRAVLPPQAYPSIAPTGPLPDELVALIGKSPYYKVEWMDGGKYVAKLSDKYQSSIISFDDIREIASKLKCSPKVVDTCNFVQLAKAYETWVVSLDHPGKIVEYTGYAFWKDMGMLKTRVKMCSIRFDLTGVVTVTIMHRQHKSEEKKE